MIGEDEPVEGVSARRGPPRAGGVWDRQLADATRRYLRCERYVVESETDSDAWEAWMEAAGREDADPRGDWETANRKSTV